MYLSGADIRSEVLYRADEQGISYEDAESGVLKSLDADEIERYNRHCATGE